MDNLIQGRVLVLKIWNAIKMIINKEINYFIPKMSDLGKTST